MIQNVLRELGGIGVYGMISLCLFFLFFIGMLVWAFCLKKSYVKTMSRLPLENGDATTASTSTTDDTRHE
jgi:cytochrome c oxidase cbb3-type subunit 4